MIDNEIPKHRSSKDTRRWCKGVIGREHKPECVPYGDQKYAKEWRNWQCSACGKVLKRWWPLRLGEGVYSEAKPDWVTK